MWNKVDKKCGLQHKLQKKTHKAKLPKELSGV